MNKFTKDIIDFCLELLYPKRCVACEKVLLKIEKEMGFCMRCAKNIKLVGTSYCMKCGAPLLKEGEEFCRNCNATYHYFDQSKAVFRYVGGMKDSIYRFKYSNRRCYADVYAAHTIRNYGSWLKSLDVEAIIPVPMYSKKEKRRGYNQADVYAKKLGSALNIPVENEIVRRNNNTTAMKRLNQLKRKKNLLKAFTTLENGVQFKKVLIVDDIYTTGTTMDEVARVLKEQGVEKVYGMCICIGEAQ